MEKFDYVIVGGGLAGFSAIKGIREKDETGSILMVGSEDELPYDRPPLSKDLLLGEMKPAEIRLAEEDFYRRRNVELKLGVRVVEVDPKVKRIRDDQGERYEFRRLLLATGGTPKRLDISGGDLNRINYYRNFEDYRNLKRELDAATDAIVLGGSFIGSELTAALALNDLEVAVVFPEKYLLEKVFPSEVGKMVQQTYIDKGVKILNQDLPQQIEEGGSSFVVHTRSGEELASDLLVAGIGISPSQDLAKKAGLAVEDGVLVDEYLRTTNEDIYAAGDVACFPFSPADRNLARIEHWDHAKKQGRQAGRNMAGENEAYDYIPYFFSDLFDYGFEAVGDVSTDRDTFVDWLNEGSKCVVYYLSDQVVKGVLLFGVWGKKKEARSLIKENQPLSEQELVGKIK